MRLSDMMIKKDSDMQHNCFLRLTCYMEEHTRQKHANINIFKLTCDMEVPHQRPEFLISKIQK